MIVRLKDRRTKFRRLAQEFQFYDSPIKSLQLVFDSLNRYYEFQFYDSPIKS